MARRKPLIDARGEVRELTAADMRRFRPAADILPPSLRKKLRVRGPQRTPTKKAINIRLSEDVLEAFRASGPGWQTRMDEALKAWIRRHPPRAA